MRLLFILAQSVENRKTNAMSKFYNLLMTHAAYPAGPAMADVLAQIHRDQRLSNYAEWPATVKSFANRLEGDGQLDADSIREISQMLDDLAKVASALADKSEKK